MKKLLINCSFSYYKKGTLSKKDNYALVVEVHHTIGSIYSNQNIERAIYDALKVLNFEMPDYKSEYHYSLSFTAQPF